MLFDPETVNHLKPWLIRTLEPICDAEPGALADYILALLKHQAPETELRKELIAQLEEFLEKEGASFVDTLFTALRTKSYLPYSSTPSSSSASFASSSTATGDSGIPIPLDALLAASFSSPERSRKRGIDDDYDQHGPSKGARLNNDGQFTRYGGRGRGDDRSSWGGRGDRGGGGGRMAMNGVRADYMDGGMQGMEMSMGMNGGGMGMNGRGGHQGYRPPEMRRGICRDYHNNGYCARGAFCKYSHGDDAVIPSQLFPMGPGGMGFMPMMGPGGMQFPIGAGATAGAAYDPHERMDMRPMGGMGGGRGQNTRPAVLPRTVDGDKSIPQNPGELPVIQDLTPQVPIEDVSPHNTGEGFQQLQEQQQQRSPMEGIVHTGEMNGGGPAPYFTGPGADGHAQSRSYSLNGRGGGRGRGRGTFGGDAQSFRPTQRREDKTLVVEKIPEDKLSLGAVNDWFSKFGTVTNVAVDAASSKALVSFTNHEDAHKAWKSEEAVFGNRFVKVFWHRPMEGHGQVGQRMLAASANIVAQRAATTGGGTAPSVPSAAAHEGSPAPQNPAPTTSAPSASRNPSASTSAAAALAAKQKLLEQQIGEQKSLMSKLSTASPGEKKEIMARLRKLGEEMKPSSTPAAASSSASPHTSSSSPHPKRTASAPRTEEQERVERERLDKELELHHVEGDGEEESTEELKAKLEKLKAEAASLGIPIQSDGSSLYGSSTYRPYRGRGRGGSRSFYRGAMRGGPPRASMKLDNRPKKLLVIGASLESLQAVRDWYETTGQVDSVERMDGGDIVVSFRSRTAAEQGFAKGTHIATVGPVQVSWFSGQAAGTLTHASSDASMSSVTDSHKDAAATHGASGYADDGDSHMHQEEAEPETGGWGGDDDGFGMM